MIYFKPPNASSIPTLCRAIFDDGRELTFEDATPLQYSSSLFTFPFGCHCSDRKDLAIVIDRSDLVTQSMWSKEKVFLRSLTDGLDISPSAYNLAVINYNTPAWETLTMAEGVSRSNTIKALDGMKCCTMSVDPEKECCCCGTSISAGLRLAVNNLKKGRIGVEKAMVVLITRPHDTTYLGDPCRVTLS